MINQTNAQLTAQNLSLKAQLKALQDVPKLASLQPKPDDRLIQLLEIMPAGVVVISHLGLVEQCNPAAVSLLCDQLLGRQWREVVAECFAPQADDGHEISLKDGRRVSIATRALLGNQGQLVLLTNLTETRLLQGQLAHSKRLNEMGKMMASLAHQIRTPLSAALLYTGNLTREDLSAPKRQKFANKVKIRLHNIEQQISDMLVLARGENKLTDTISVSMLFQRLEDGLDVPLAQYDADCDLFSNGIEKTLLCNPEMLTGALLNLVINGLQASGDNPYIKIEAQMISEWLVISVIDNGSGMDTPSLKKAQEPFYTTKSHGTGLGLSVAQVVAKAHNGRFEMVSELGEGTVAAFWLPVI